VQLTVVAKVASRRASAAACNISRKRHEFGALDGVTGIPEIPDVDELAAVPAEQHEKDRWRAEVVRIEGECGEMAVDRP